MESSPKQRWQAPGTGAWYEERRWSHAGRRRRDPALVGALLGELLPQRDALVLDAPCGTGRLRETVEAHGCFVGLEISASMLARARMGAGDRLVRGDVERLPFRDRAFAAVVCCRLLHHLRTRSELVRALAELVRVSDGPVLASFWDAGSLEAWSGRWGLARRARHRVEHDKSLVEAAVEEAGARVVRWRHSLRFLSRQTWLVAERRA